MRNAILILLSQISQATPSEQLPDIRQTMLAKTLVNQMAAAEFEKVVEPFDETMSKALPAEKIKQVWEGIRLQYGKFQRIGDTRTEVIPKYRIIFVTMEFERGKLDTKAVFNAESRIAGLFFVPTGKYQSPAYVKASAFDEVEVAVGKGLFPLTGTLALPKDAGPFPAVILVHGSGPQDRDETIGSNKPFRDLAQGLASQGVAVLRYEKRTRQHALAMVLVASSITVKEETVDDAAAAVESLVGHEKIDTRRIFVLGHSLGGMLLPKIGQANKRISGFISLAGSTRPLEDLVLEQTKYILSLDGPLTDEKQKQIDEVERQVAKVKSDELTPQTSSKELPLGVPAKYWLDLRSYDPAEAAKGIEKPMLILQGERDYQVTMEDFGRWKQALGSRPQVKFTSFPKLNHLFMEGQGKSTPAEYDAPGNVAETVIGAIASWILSQGSN